MNKGTAGSPFLLDRWLPRPAISAVLVAVWVALHNEFSVAVLVLGGLLGVSVPLLTTRLWPAPPRILSLRKALAYVLLVSWDIVVANVAVARVVLFRPVAQMRMCWITVPLDLVTPEAITVFASTITMTPGTVSCDLSADGRSLLVHCLDAPDAEEAVAAMKVRYESRLKEIFE